MKLAVIVAVSFAAGGWLGWWVAARESQRVHRDAERMRHFLDGIGANNDIHTDWLRRRGE